MKPPTPERGNTSTDTAPVHLDAETATQLAAELLRALTPHAGDPDAVNRVLRHWNDVLDVQPFGITCMAAVQLVFTECLTRVPAAELPPGGLVLHEPAEERKSA